MQTVCFCSATGEYIDGTSECATIVRVTISISKADNLAKVKRYFVDKAVIVYELSMKKCFVSRHSMAEQPDIIEGVTNPANSSYIEIQVTPVNY